MDDAKIDFFLLIHAYCYNAYILNVSVMGIVLGSSFGLAAILVFAVIFYRRKR